MTPAVRPFVTLAVAVAAILLGLFLIAEAAGVPILTDPTPWLARRGPLAASVAVSLLTVDALLPVPSSVVMVALGALFGAPLGAALGLAGSLGSFAVAYGAGRAGSTAVRGRVPAHERARAERLLARWGLLAIVASRPVPLAAETVAVLAGAAAMPLSRALPAAAAGALPPAVLYGLAGAAAATLLDGAVVFLAVVVVAALVWCVAGRRELDRAT